jgi:hypothetical protein
LPKKKKTKPLSWPTLEQCERALGEKAKTWVARCYEISCRIVAAGLVDGTAVYGHWVGDVSPQSYFASRSRSLPFVNHGWIVLNNGRVLDPTRWVFEAVPPYIYVGEPPDPWGVTPCMHCGLLKEEHRDGGPEDQCDMYEMPKWPYDEGGNEWRDAIDAGRPKPVPTGPRKKLKLEGWVAAWVAMLLEEKDGAKLTMNQLFYLSNLSYTTMFGAVGPEGVRAIYTAIADLNETAISWIPIDNAERAKRECGFDRA